MQHKNIQAMTKAELAKKVAQTTGVDKATAVAVIEGMMEEVKKSVIAKNNVYLRGFGTFNVKHRAAKTARNITAKQTVHVEAHDIPFFKPCPEFVDAVKNSR